MPRNDSTPKSSPDDNKSVLKPRSDSSKEETNHHGNMPRKDSTKISSLDDTELPDTKSDSSKEETNHHTLPSDQTSSTSTSSDETDYLVEKPHLTKPTSSSGGNSSQSEPEEEEESERKSRKRKRIRNLKSDKDEPKQKGNHKETTKSKRKQQKRTSRAESKEKIEKNAKSTLKSKSNDSSKTKASKSRVENEASLSGEHRGTSTATKTYVPESSTNNSGIHSKDSSEDTKLNKTNGSTTTEAGTPSTPPPNPAGPPKLSITIFDKSGNKPVTQSRLRGRPRKNVVGVKSATTPQEEDPTPPPQEAAPTPPDNDSQDAKEEPEKVPRIDYNKPRLGWKKRSSWKARRTKLEEDECFLKLPARTVVFVTNTEVDECETYDHCAYSVRQIQRHSMDTLGLKDIAYNWVLGGDHVMYEGLGWGCRSPVAPDSTWDRVVGHFIYIGFVGRYTAASLPKQLLTKALAFMYLHKGDGKQIQENCKTMVQQKLLVPPNMYRQ